MEIEPLKLIPAAPDRPINTPLLAPAGEKLKETLDLLTPFKYKVRDLLEETIATCVHAPEANGVLGVVAAVPLLFVVA